MTEWLRSTGLNALPIICVVSAVVLLVLRIEDGWGWLLFLTIITAVAPGCKKSEEPKP